MLDHEYFMRLALEEARKAASEEEVPTGCVIVENTDGVPSACVKILGKAHNQTEQLKDPTAHAEMLAITQAASTLGDFRLVNTVLYVTKEPCAMCAGAIVLARIPLVVYGVSDPKRGGQSVFGIMDSEALIHRARIVKDVLSDECKSELQSFFKKQREK